MVTIEEARRNAAAREAKRNPPASEQTLRDYFAAKAMQALIHVQVKTAQQMTAETAYQWADAMLKAREA